MLPKNHQRFSKPIVIRKQSLSPRAKILLLYRKKKQVQKKRLIRKQMGKRPEGKLPVLEVIIPEVLIMVTAAHRVMDPTVRVTMELRIIMEILILTEEQTEVGIHRMVIGKLLLPVRRRRRLHRQIPRRQIHRRQKLRRQIHHKRMHRKRIRRRQKRRLQPGMIPISSRIRQPDILQKMNYTI